MGYALNDAFAGVHNANGLRFLIVYLDKKHLAPYNVGKPPGHAEYRKIGWYLCRDGIAAVAGPFTSSRKAYKAAMMALASEVKAA